MRLLRRTPRLRRGFLVSAAVLFVACSDHSGDADAATGDHDAASDDTARVVPEGLEIEALEGGNGGLEVIALTLRRGANNSELFAALKNTGDGPACSAALSVELYDRMEQSVASGIDGLLTRYFYRRTDGSSAIAACVGPGDVTMAAITDLPADLAIEDVQHVVYRCPHFALDVRPIDGLEVEGVKRVQRGAATAYAGKLVNRLDVTVRNASVTVFPVNRAGRPLGVTIASESGEIPPGETWAFETAAVDVAAADFVAFPAGALGE